MKTYNRPIQNAKMIGKTAPIFNHYMEFGSSVMGKYSGMSAMINPLALLYLQGEEAEEQQPQPQKVTYIQNRIYKVTHHEYNMVANRYLINHYNMTQAIRENPIYASSPVFRQLTGHTETKKIQQNAYLSNTQIRPVSFIHSEVEHVRQNTEIQQNEKKENIRELIKTAVKEVIVTERKDSVLEILREVPQAENRLYTVLEKELKTVIQERVKYTEKEIQKEFFRIVETAVEEAVKRLPDEKRKVLSARQGQNLRSTQNQILTVQEKNRFTETINQQFQTLLTAQTVHAVQSSQMSQNTILNRTQQNLHYLQSIQNLQIVQNAAARQRKGKELFQTQIMGRLNPLPVRPVNLVFAKESEEETETKPMILQKTNVVMKRENQAEYKYYTHILERFLKGQDKTEIHEIDRKSMPAGVIWHDRPKETVRFERRDVVQIPVELIYDKTVPDQTGDIISEKTVSAAQQMIQNTMQQTVQQNVQSFKQEIKVSAAGKMIREMETAEEIFMKYGEERHVVRKNQPVFTEQNFLQNIVSNQNVVHGVQYGWNGNTLELIIPNDTKASSHSEELTKVFRKVSENLTAGNTFGPTVPNTVRNISRITPVSLVYKSETAPEEKTEAEKKEEITEFLDDIVFEKKTISEKKQTNDIAVEQVSDDSVEIPEVTITGPAGGNGKVTVSRTEVDTIISEKVSRHVDENISKISRQVYKDIERQLKKERDRRGR